MDRDFRWNAWNLEHIAEHGMSPQEAEYLVLNARSPYPESAGHGKWIVAGRLKNGIYCQVVFTLDDDETAYVIHARPLTDQEKKKYRRRIR